MNIDQQIRAARLELRILEDESQAKFDEMKELQALAGKKQIELADLAIAKNDKAKA